MDNSILKEAKYIWEINISNIVLFSIYLCLFIIISIIDLARGSLLIILDFLFVVIFSYFVIDTYKDIKNNFLQAYQLLSKIEK